MRLGAPDVVLVTGGGSGLGAATVRSVVAAGSRALIVDLPSSGGGALAVELGESVAFVAADVRDADQVQRAPQRHGCPGSELQRGPVVLERAERDDDGAVRHAAALLDKRRDVAGRLREHAGEWTGKRIPACGEQEQVGVLLHAEPDDVRSRRGRCESGDARAGYSRR